MAEIPQSVRAVVPGVLPKTFFRTEQERLNAYCSVMTISAQAGKPGLDGVGLIGEKGEKGDSSGSADKTVKTVDVPEDATSVDCDVDVEDAIINLVNNTSAPTISVRGVSGSIVYLSAAAPDANYKLKIINFTS